jgi:UTP--glucose-1-phosphate uridylyltransferase
MKKITKAVFPVAGYGTRMLPSTKSIPKELLPLYDTPIIDCLVEECINEGIDEVIFITSKEKNSLENYFDSLPELEKKLENKKDFKSLKNIQKFKNIKISFVRQGDQKGDGHAILQARHLLQDESFLVVFGDDITFGKESSVKQLIEAYNEKKSSIVAVTTVDRAKISSYGVVDISTNYKINKINNVIEKPLPEKSPSNKAIIGKYICTNNIWDALEKSSVSEGGEYRLIDAFDYLIKNNQSVFSCTISGNRFDTGSKKGYAMASLFFAIKNKKITQKEVLDLLDTI